MVRQLHTMFFSPTGGTAQVVKAVAESIGDAAIQHDVTLPSVRAEAVEFGADDVLVVGVPVFSGRVPAVAANFLEGVRGDSTPVVLVAVYGNRAYEDALLELCNICRARGFRCVAAGAFIAQHSMTPLLGTGRPDAVDLEAARVFGAAAAASLSMAENWAGELDVPGNCPYRERSSLPVMGPTTAEACRGCGVCAERCPTNAIDLDDFTTVDPERCILCGSCVKRCPEGAKSFIHPEYLKLIHKLETNFATPRKEPEWFVRQ
jgi:ferredoxin